MYSVNFVNVFPYHLYDHEILIENLAMAFKKYEESILDPAVLAAREEMAKKGFEDFMLDNRHMMDVVHNFAADFALRVCGKTTAHPLESTEKAAARDA